MKIFITGGTGFIGEPVVKKLLKHKIMFSKRLEHMADWKQEVIDFKPDVAIHMAWEGIPDYSFDQSYKNFIYTMSLFDLLYRAGCKKVICVGSCWEHKEMDNPFVDAKKLIYQLGRYIFKNNGIVFIWARLFYVYGPKQRNESLIPHILASLDENKTLELISPEDYIDYIHVDDVASAIVALLDIKESGAYDIGSGILTRNKDIVANIYKLKQRTGWEPSVSMEEALRRLIDD